MAERWDAQGNPVVERWTATGSPVAPHKEDIPRAAASGAKRSFISLPGMLGDLENLWGQAVEKGFRALPEDWIRAGGGNPEAIKASPLTDYAALNDHITGAQANQVWDKMTGDKPYEPVTQGEKYARSLGATAPALLGIGAGVAPTIGAMLAGGAGSEFLGQGAQGFAPEWENEARFLGGVGGGLAGAKVGSASGAAIGKVLDGFEQSPSTLGMMGGGIRRKSGPKPPTVEINKTLAERAGYLGPKGPEKFDEWYSPYQASGADPFKFQAYQEPGVSKTASLARQPGETPQLAREKIEGPITGDKQRSGARYKMQTRAVTAADEMTGGPAKLAEEYKAASDAYKGILNEDAVSPSLADRAGKILDRVDDADHDGIIAEAQKLARAEGVPEMNKAQTLQFVKRALWQKAEALAEKPATAQRGFAYKQIFNELRDVLHGEDGIPGYKQVDNAYADIVKRKDAAEALRDKILTKPEGHAPGTIAMNPSTMEEMAITFGEQPASKFILNQRLLGQDAREFNRVAPWSGSPTVAHAAEAFDTNAMIADALKSGKPVEGAISGFGHFIDKTLGGFSEKGRNALGADLLQQMSPAQAAAFRAKLAELQAQKRAQDLAQALSAPGAIQGGGNPPQ